MKRTTKVRISLLLVVCMLLSGLPNAVSVAATEADKPLTSLITESTPTETLAVTKQAAVTEEVPVLQLDEDCQILNHVDPEVFAAGNHIARLPEQETLSSYVFLNADGTQTVYYMDQPVKFEKADGTVVEKNLTLTAATEGYTTTQNDIQLTIPTNPTNGIRLVYGNRQITLIPQGGTLNKTAQATDNSVTYLDYYGEGMSLRYTPTLSGVKEDILLDAYSGVNSFTFRLNTGGLNLYQANGRYYLAESKAATERIELGDVVSYDAKSKFNIGTMTAQTIMKGQSYMLTLTVDEAFLTNENTVYPVTIDPTLTVSYGNNGDDYIIDAPIFEGYPNNNYGAFQYNRVGYVDSSYQSGRTVVKLPVLTSSNIYTSLAAEGITSVKFYVKEATGTSGISVRLYPLVSLTTWTESTVTWNNLGACDSVVVDTQTLTDSAWSAFDITELVKKWKTGFYSGTQGFLMIGANEDSLDKSFCSSEHAKTNYRPYVVMTYAVGTGGGSNFSSAVTLSVGNTVSVATAYANETRYFTFTPAITATYVIQSCNYSGDPYIWLYDSSQAQIEANNDGGSNWNFWISKELLAGHKYYIRVGHSGTLTGSYNLTLLRVADKKDTFYKFKNESSEQYLDIHGPVEQVMVHQWTEHTGEQQKWYLETIDGYYTIRSQYGDNKYIGITNTNIGENNIQLFDTISDYTKWTIYVTSAGTYILEPKMGKCKALYSPSSSTGIEMQLAWIGLNGNADKWFIPSYDYWGVTTFSAFDLGNSAEDEVALFKSRMERMGYLDIGSFNNANENISANKVKEIGRYSDIIYINGHGHGYANIQVRTNGGSVISEYLCAEDTVNTNLYPKTEIGAEWLYEGVYSATESYWDKGTKWGILAPCAQLNTGTDGEGAHWNGLNSAAIWARTMRGRDNRMHGYLGFFEKAPGGSTHYSRLEEFFDLCEDGKTLVNAWADCNTVIGLGSSDWAAIYHVENANDRFTNMSSDVPYSSQYTICYLGRGSRDFGLIVAGTDTVSATQAKGILQNNIPIFVSTDENIQAAETKFNLLRNKLTVSEGDIFEIDDSGQIKYSVSNRDWGKENLEYDLTNEQVVEIAKRELSKLGLLPQDEYRIGITTKERTFLDITGRTICEPETIEYSVFFYRTYNGVDIISDKEDGILISFDKNGLTELRYLWRDAIIVEKPELAVSSIATSDYLTFEQAQKIYNAQWESADQMADAIELDDALTDECPFARMTYLQTENGTRLVWVFSTSENYTNSVCIDARTGEIITM